MTERDDFLNLKLFSLIYHSIPLFRTNQLEFSGMISTLSINRAKKTKNLIHGPYAINVGDFMSLVRSKHCYLYKK